MRPGTARGTRGSWPRKLPVTRTPRVRAPKGRDGRDGVLPSHQTARGTAPEEYESVTVLRRGREGGNVPSSGFHLLKPTRPAAAAPCGDFTSSTPSARV